MDRQGQSAAAGDDWIVLLAKAPIAGEAKTRLARDVGLLGAQRLAEAFVIDTLKTLLGCPGTCGLIAYAPDAGREWFEQHAPGARLTCQPDAPFGERVEAAIRKGFELGARKLVVIGMDTPQLEAASLMKALEALDSADLCMGPALDGGYYLIGMRHLEPALFEDIPWSTPDVYGVTLERATNAGLRVAELPPEFDIDDGGDLAALADVLVQRPNVATRTRAVLFDLV